MKQLQPSERRIHPRQVRRIPIRYTVMGNGTTAESTTRDVSLGGLFVLAQAPPPIGTKLSMWFLMPTLRDPVEATGVVRWSEVNVGFGVQFDGLRAREVYALNKWLATPPEEE